MSIAAVHFSAIFDDNFFLSESLKIKYLSGTITVVPMRMTSLEARQ